MKGSSRCLLLLFACFAALLLRGQEETPFTRLFDTGVASIQPLPDEAIAKRVGWTLVPEDKVDHLFTGDTVMLNDRLAVVLRKQGRGAEVYSKAVSGLKHRATLGHARVNSTVPDALDALKIIENTASAVMVEVNSRSAEPAALRFRLTTGETILEIRPEEGAKSVNVLTKTRYVVVPDYFGDDLVFGVEALRGLCLPAENFCLSLLDGSDAIVMTVWQSSQQEVSASTSTGGEAALCSSSISCLKSNSIWLAFLEAPALWHVGSASSKDNWQPPFPAKWRCSALRVNGVADSWTTEKPDGTVPKRSADFSPPLSTTPAVKQTEVRASADPLLVYPIDRSAATPLTATCPTDVMRNTLGVGPCQYILACEGLAAQGDPTPNAVMNWVEKQFEQKRQRKVANDIEERLSVMNEHVVHARARIQRYSEFAGQVRKLLAGKPGAEPFLPMVDDLERSAVIGLGPTASPEQAKQLADEIAALTGQADTLAACQRLGAQLRAIGSVQDRTLAKCRMAIKRLQAKGRTTAASQPLESSLAKSLQKLTGQMLDKK